MLRSLALDSAKDLAFSDIYESGLREDDMHQAIATSSLRNRPASSKAIVASSRAVDILIVGPHPLVRGHAADVPEQGRSLPHARVASQPWTGPGFMADHLAHWIFNVQATGASSPVVYR